MKNQLNFSDNPKVYYTHPARRFYSIIINSIIFSSQIIFFILELLLNYFKQKIIRIAILNLIERQNVMNKIK